MEIKIFRFIPGGGMADGSSSKNNFKRSQMSVFTNLRGKDEDMDV